MYKERKWFLLLEEIEVEMEIRHHVESKVGSQELEEQHQKAQVI